MQNPLRIVLANQQLSLRDLGNPAAEAVCLTNCRCEAWAELFGELSFWPHLRELSLDGCSLDDAGAAVIAQRLPRLEVLHLGTVGLTQTATA